MKKLILIAAMGATALTSLAGTASAQETYAVTKYEYLRDNGVDTYGLTFGLSGQYDSGFAYDMELMSADTNGTGMIGASVELGYRFGGIAGPVALYETSKLGGLHADQFLIGVEGGTDLMGAGVFGKALFDADDADVYRLGIGAEYMIGADLAVTGALTHFGEVGLPNSNRLEIGARYRLTGNMHADLGARYDRAHGGAEKTGLHMGLGFSF
jgi:hypothetical protein